MRRTFHATLPVRTRGHEDLILCPNHGRGKQSPRDTFVLHETNVIQLLLRFRQLCYILLHQMGGGERKLVEGEREETIR